ncbi:hypothetical protein CsatB_006831 [Cannabis sativa]
MVERTESAEAKSESLIEKITEKIHGHGDSSSSSSDSASEQVKPESSSSVKTKIFRLFGRERPVHQVFVILLFFLYLGLLVLGIEMKCLHFGLNFVERLHAQALTLTALAGAAVVEYYDHRTGKKADQYAKFLPNSYPHKD